jgi:hypothetical protein
MKKNIFLKKLSKLLKVKINDLEKINLVDNEDFDSLKQLELIAFYDNIIKDEKIVKKISLQTNLSKVLDILKKSKFIK